MSNFVYRTLHESEMGAWFEHCGTIFGRDKQYFVNHWFVIVFLKYISFLCFFENQFKLTQPLVYLSFVFSI